MQRKKCFAPMHSYRPPALHRTCRTRTRTSSSLKIAQQVSGKEQDPGSPWQNWPERSRVDELTVPQNSGLDVWSYSGKVILGRRWLCAFHVCRSDPQGRWWPMVQCNCSCFNYNAFVNTGHTDDPLHFFGKVQMLNSHRF